MAPTKKGSEKKGHSAINEVVTKEHTFNIHSTSMERVSRKMPLGHSKDIQKFAVTEMGMPDVHNDMRLDKAVWAKGIRNVPYFICVQLPENVMRMKIPQTSLYIGYLCTCHYFQKPTVNMDEN